MSDLSKTDAAITSQDGTRLAVRRSGRGSPLVLVHGALGNIDSFALVEPLLAARHEVWVYSWRDHAGSDDAVDVGLDRQVEDVLAVVEAAGGDVHLCGCSTGAVYAIGAAQHATALRSVVAYEPPLKLDALVVAMHAEVTAALETGGPDHALEQFLPYAGVTAADAAFVRTQAEVWDQLREGVRILPRELEALIGRPQSVHPAAPDVPMLYLHGELTESPSSLTADEVRASFPRAEIRALPGQRHLAPVLDPVGFVATVVDFTTAVDASVSSRAVG